MNIIKSLQIKNLSFLIIILSVFSSLFFFHEVKASAFRLHRPAVRELAVISDGEGYYPEKLVAFVGETVRLFFTSTFKQGGCFIMDEYGLHEGVQMGEIKAIEITFETAGTYSFSCPTGKTQGKFVILDKLEVRENEMELRGGRSSTDSDQWRPKRDSYFENN